MQQTVSGLGVSSGIAFGSALTLAPQIKFDGTVRIQPKQVTRELSRFNDARQSLANQLTSQIQELKQHIDRSLLIEAELMILEDDELRVEIHDAISSLLMPAHIAISYVIQKHADEMSTIEDNYLAARSKDITNLGQRLIKHCMGLKRPNFKELSHDTILIAHDITPAEFSALPMKYIKGLVLAEGGFTCHTAILARAAGIPALVNCQIAPSVITRGSPVILDANSQQLFISPTKATINQLKKLQTQLQSKQKSLQKIRLLDSKTLDGVPIPLLANISCQDDITHSITAGATGIGLLRTELMLLNLVRYPDEKLQYNIYLNCLSQLKGKPFTFRTLDIGGDKKMAWLNLPAEPNPALGMRGIRYCLAHPDVFHHQLRALLRVANHWPVKLIFPMINQVEELEAVIDEIELCKQQLLEREQGFGELQLGLNIETPAAVLNLASMLPLVDFVSIGTNDLTQYTMAADRGLLSLSDSFPSLSPPLLQLIKQCIDICHQQGVTVSMCGELAANPKATKVLIGLGLNEFSISPNRLLEIKSIIRQTDTQYAKKIALQALKYQRLDELNTYLDEVNQS